MTQANKSESAAAGKGSLVCVGRWQDGGTIMVVPASDLAAPVVFAKWNSAVQEQALRAVFEEAGISPLAEPVGHWKAKKALKYPLPHEPFLAARLIGEILRTGYGLGYLASITFFYHEPK